MKKLIAMFAVVGLLTLLLVACGGGSNGGSSSGNTVHLSSTNFVQPSITINKGESLTLIDDVAVPHVIDNGAWDNGTAKPNKDSGSPLSKPVNFNGNDSQTIGPFTTAGTFHFYCTIHPDMNLVVTVQ